MNVGGCLLDLGGDSLFIRLDLVIDMAINPEIGTYLAIWMLVAANPVPHIIFELSFIYLSILPRKFTPTILNIVRITALKLVSIVGLPHSFSFSLSIAKLPFIGTSILPGVVAYSVKVAVNIAASINISVDKFFHSLTILESIPKLSFII